MRNLITLIILITISLSANAQMTFEETTKSSTNPELTTLIVQDTSYLVAVTSKGSLKMKRISKKSGNEYWMYLGYPTTHKHQDHVVFSDNKDNPKYWYYVVGSTGYPKKVTLTAK